MKTSNDSFPVAKILSAKKIIAAVIGFHLLFAFHCNKSHEGECNYIAIAPISTVNVPDSGLANTVISIPIQYNMSNGCGRFLSMEENNQGNNRNVTVRAQYQGCVCTMVFLTQDTVYQFMPTSAGTYYLNFQQTDSSYIRDSIIVQ